jgi:hypothetical protein
MQTMILIRQLGITFLAFGVCLIVADVVLILLGASVRWLIGAGLLLTAPTVYRVIKLMDDVHIGGWRLRRRKHQDEQRLPRPIH